MPRNDNATIAGLLTFVLESRFNVLGTSLGLAMLAVGQDLSYRNQGLPIEIAWTLALGCGTLLLSRRVSDATGCLSWALAALVWLLTTNIVGKSFVGGDPLVPGLFLVSVMLLLWMGSRRPQLHPAEVASLVVLSLAMAYGADRPLTQEQWIAAAASPLAACAAACFLSSRGLSTLFPTRYQAWLALALLVATSVWLPLLVATWFLLCLSCLSSPNLRLAGTALSLLSVTLLGFAPQVPAEYLAVARGLLAVALVSTLALQGQGRLSPLFLVPAAVGAAVVAGKAQAPLTLVLALVVGVLLAGLHRRARPVDAAY